LDFHIYISQEATLPEGYKVIQGRDGTNIDNHSKTQFCHILILEGNGNNLFHQKVSILGNSPILHQGSHIDIQEKASKLAALHS
jgi:hypothetical protein